MSSYTSQMAGSTFSILPRTTFEEYDPTNPLVNSLRSVQAQLEQLIADRSALPCTSAVVSHHLTFTPSIVTIRHLSSPFLGSVNADLQTTTSFTVAPECGESSRSREIPTTSRYGPRTEPHAHAHGQVSNPFQSREVQGAEREKISVSDLTDGTGTESQGERIDMSVRDVDPAPRGVEVGHPKIITRTTVKVQSPIIPYRLWASSRELLKCPTSILSPLVYDSIGSTTMLMYL